MAKPFVAGNWKMNTDSASGVALVKELASKLDADVYEKVDVMVCPPFVYIPGVVGALSSSGVAVGAQDLYFEEKGAFTGEISTAMLKDVGCTYVLCGHSERRHVLGEDDAMVNKKLIAAIAGGLLPILCVGETIQERKAGKMEEVVTRQVKLGLAGLDAEKMAAVTVAYEPVWAIGTGETASPEQAQEVHALIRGLLTEMFSAELASETRIQYGGSVKAGNAAELMGQADIDGALVGGASLKADDFVAIIKAAIK
jgi:triosephosphate isomerase